MTVGAIFTQRPPSVLPKQSLFVHVNCLLNIQWAIMRAVPALMGMSHTPPSFWLCGNVLRMLS